jgi:hypothetical protein
MSSSSPVATAATNTPTTRKMRNEIITKSHRRKLELVLGSGDIRFQRSGSGLVLRMALLLHSLRIGTSKPSVRSRAARTDVHWHSAEAYRTGFCPDRCLNWRRMRRERNPPTCLRNVVIAGSQKRVLPRIYSIGCIVLRYGCLDGPMHGAIQFNSERTSTWRGRNAERRALKWLRKRGGLRDRNSFSCCAFFCVSSRSSPHAFSS